MSTRRRNILIIGVVGIAFIIFISVFGAINMDKAPVFTLVLYAGLIVVTMFYAYYSMETANAAREQADASVKMAEEMREQRYDTVRPVIDIYRDSTGEDKMSEAFDATKGDASRGLSCALCNVGLGPAIDLYSFLQTSSGSERYECGTLAVGEKTPRMKLSMNNEINKDHPSDLWLVALYRDVYDREFISSREVSVDKERKGAWSIGPLDTRKIAKEEFPK